MSANPYGGFGYHSGLVQALAGQLQGEAQREEIARKQQQVAFNQQMALNQFMAQQEQMRQAEVYRQNADRRADESLTLQKDAAARAADKDAWWRKLQEEELEIKRQPKATGLTPIQKARMEMGGVEEDAGIESLQGIVDLFDGAPTRQVDAPGWFTGTEDSGELDDAKGSFGAAWKSHFGDKVPMPTKKAAAVQVLRQDLERRKARRAVLDKWLFPGRAAAGGSPSPAFAGGVEITPGSGITIGGMRDFFAPIGDGIEVKMSDDATPEDYRRAEEWRRKKGKEMIAEAGGSVAGPTMDRAALAAKLKALKDAGKMAEFEALRKWIISQGIK